MALAGEDVKDIAGFHRLAFGNLFFQNDSGLRDIDFQKAGVGSQLAHDGAALGIGSPD